ncbi:putative oxidoreductase [Mycolicibacterium madagascariense]|uniref:Putative oxidoreductase n=1 Tax=Mycolicibacterium madagascariense TaxID=212765 RepID=A0A7I7X8B9_9MYCO|nr:aldo/keto reductase [Mycolicibacterium madagascariense]MCV7014175.1 aldo/keto reductase [Mycolicibacterium madagascariense]BBZ25784.1 putative oxidoreductase [Mycolicibacterium madagascariense]
MITTRTPIPAIALRDGTTIPQLGFGTLAVQPDRTSTSANVDITATTVGHALRAGYRHIDTAQSYGTEAGVGRAIATAEIPRAQLYLTSKLANGNHGPDDVRRSFDQTLTHLGVDYLDLFLIHWPLPTLYGGDYVSTWTAITDFVAEGRLRSAGVSNFQPAHLQRIIDETGHVPVVNQFELHPYFANTAAVTATRQHGIAVEAHSPLGHSGEPLTDETISRIAAAHHKSPAQVVLRWHVQHGHVAIPKSAQPQRMIDNINVFDFELSTEELTAIDALDRGADGRVGPNPDVYDGI